MGGICEDWDRRRFLSFFFLSLPAVSAIVPFFDRALLQSNLQRCRASLTPPEIMTSSGVSRVTSAVLIRRAHAGAQAAKRKAMFDQKFAMQESSKRPRIEPTNDTQYLQMTPLTRNQLTGNASSDEELRRSGTGPAIASPLPALSCLLFFDRSPTRSPGHRGAAQREQQQHLSSAPQRRRQRGEHVKASQRNKYT